MANPALTPVDGDPFAVSAALTPRLVPVDHDPFKGATAPPAPVDSKPTTAGDLALSAASGLAKGVLAVGSLPGNIEHLGRMGVDAGARALGYPDPKSRENWMFPGYQQYKADLEQRLGFKLHDPKTAAGRYVGAATEMLPALAAGPGSIAQKLGAATGAGVGSEAAGDATKGTAMEPVARIAGAMAGAGLPNVVGRAYTPVATSAERQAAVQTLRKEGVDSLTAGEITGSKPLRYLEGHASDIPLSGGRAHAMGERAAEQFTNAALRRAGADTPHVSAAIQAAGGNPRRATPETMDAIYRSLGDRFDTLAQRSQAVLGLAERNNMQQIVNSYERVMAPQARSNAVRGWMDDIKGHAGNPIPGNVYSTYRSQIEADARALQRADPLGAQALRDLRSNLDKAVERSLPVDLRGQWKEVRGHWRNLLTLEKAAAAGGENAAMGLISPAQLRIATKTVGGARNYVRGSGDMAELARSGVAVMSPLPNSGTPARLMVSNTLGGIGGAAGALMGGAPAAGAMAIATPIATGLLARGFMSGPMQRYLGANARGLPAHLPMTPTRGLLSIPLAAEEGR